MVQTDSEIKLRIVGDKIGENLSMNRDGNVRGRLYLAANGKTVSRKAREKFHADWVDLTQWSNHNVHCNSSRYESE